MAVASETAETVSSLPMEPSASKSVPDSPSETSSPVRISFAAETADRSDKSNSSPNNNSEFQSSASLRSEEYRQLFRLPSDEALVQDFNCAFQESILLQGHMYLFTHYICFYSNIFGFETKKIIPFIEITSVKRAKTAGIFPNAIEIFAGGKKYFFASFLSRDEAFKLINDGWEEHCDSTKAIAEQQESISMSNGIDNEPLVDEKVNSFKEVHELDSRDRGKEASPSIDYRLSPPFLVENERDSVIVAELQHDVDKDIEPVGCTDSSSMTRTSIWNAEDADAPEIRKSFTRVGEAKFPQIKVEEFFDLFFSDDASNFMDSFHRKCGDREFRCSSWSSQENFGHARAVSFQHPIKIYFGAKFGSCHEVQKFRVYRNSHLVIETSQEINDVPYGDYFCVEGLWDVVKDESNEGCILHIYVDVSFSKKTVFRGKIVQSTLEECREAYAIWINMAHELLKQKNLERREDDCATGMIENGVSPVIEMKIEEASERSCQSNDLGRIEETSGSLDDNDQAGNVMQGNFINAASITSFLGECVVKLSTFLKSQSQISLILVVAFAVIFLMQVSIVILLSRPQKVMMAPPEEYYMGGMVGERSAESLAWLERRAHHLKDEMFMVEAQLERLRNEYSWLKAELKNLGHRKKN